MKLNNYTVSIKQYNYRNIPILLMANKNEIFYIFYCKDNWYSQSLKFKGVTTLEKAIESFENEDIGFDTAYSTLKKTIDKLL
jgi:hypothetical protein